MNLERPPRCPRIEQTTALPLRSLARLRLHRILFPRNPESTTESTSGFGSLDVDSPGRGSRFERDFDSHAVYERRISTAEL